MSTRSPTLSLSSTVGSTTRRWYFQPFGPVKETDDALLSMALIVTVIVLSSDAVPPGRSPCPAVEVPVAVLTGASPGGFSLADTVLLYVIDTLSDLELIEPLRGWGYVDRLELALGRLNVHDALGMIDGLDGARKGDGLCRERSGLRPAGQGKSQDHKPGRAQDRVYSLHASLPLLPNRPVRRWQFPYRRQTKPSVSLPTMQKLEKFHASVNRVPLVRWRVVDGASPNVARYLPAKRPSCAKPKRWATSATLTMSGSASRNARRTSFNRRSSTYWVGLMPRNRHNTTEGSGRSPRSARTIPACSKVG